MNHSSQSEILVHPSLDYIEVASNASIDFNTLDTIQDVEEKSYPDSFAKQEIFPIDEANVNQQTISEDFILASPLSIGDVEHLRTFNRSLDRTSIEPFSSIEDQYE